MAIFSDLLKKWFYTNSSSAASSDARIPLLTATGEPKGSDTMANLASVLGVGRATTGSNPDLLNQGFVSAWFETDAEAEQAGYVKRDNNIVFATSFEPTNSNYAKPQICFCTYDNSVYTRSRTSGQQVPWSSWRRIDNFGCNTLSELANALGVMPYVSQQNVSNIDSWFTYSLVYFEDSVPQVGTFPYDINVLVMTIPFQTTLGFNHRFTIQIAFSYNASKASIRFGDTQSYGAWKEFIS